MCASSCSLASPLTGPKTSEQFRTFSLHQLLSTAALSAALQIGSGASLTHVRLISVQLVLRATFCGEEAVVLRRRIWCKAVQVINLIQDAAAAPRDGLTRRRAVTGPAAQNTQTISKVNVL